MTSYKQKYFDSSTQLQNEIVLDIKDHKKNNPLAPVTLIVDQPLQGFLFRRQLAETYAGSELAALGNIKVLTLTELVEELAQNLGVRTDPQPTTQVIEAVIYSMMAKSKGQDAKSNQSLATAAAIAKVFRTLEFVGDKKLEQLLSNSDLNGTQKDVFDYVIKTRRLFGDRLGSTKLAKILESGLPSVSPRLFGQVHSLVSSLPEDIGELFEIMGASGLQVVHWRPAFVDGTLANDLPKSKLISCPDPFTEVSIVVRAVMQDLDKFRADRIAVITPSLSEYGSQIQSALNEAEIKWHGKGKFTGQQSTLFRTLELITDALAQRNEKYSGFDRPKLMRLLQNGYLSIRDVRLSAKELPEAEANESAAPKARRDPEPADDFPHVRIETKYVRKWVRKNSLYGDTAKWIPVIDSLSAQAIHENDQLSAEHLKYLINFIESDLHALANASSWSELGEGLLNLTESLHGGEIDLGDGSIEKKGWGSIRKLLLQELPLLDAIDFSSLGELHAGNQGMGLQVKGNLVNLSRWIKSQLGSRRVTSGDWSTGVFVGTVESAKFLKFDSVFVLGATEGLLPAVSKEDPFLPKKLLESLAEKDLAMNSAEFNPQNTLILLASVLASTSKTILTRPRGGTSSKLDDVESRYLPESLRKESGDTKKRFIEVASYLSSFHLTDIRLDPVTTEDAALLNPQMDNQDWDRFSRSMWAWRNPQFNEYFGNLSRLTPQTKIWHPTDLRPLSSSRIDTYLRCPYEFFALTVLGFKSNDTRDELKSFSPSAFGSFFHKEMELFIKQCKEEGSLPEAGESWSPNLVNKFLKQLMDGHVLGSFIATGRGGWDTSFWLHLRKVVRGVKLFFATEPQTLRGNPPLKIEEAEAPFGKAGNKMQLVVTDDGGEKHWILGDMDRLDVSPDKSNLGVMDFKTGSRDKQLKKLGIGKSAKQSQNVYTLQDVIYRQAVLSKYSGARVEVNFVFITEEPEDMYVGAKFAHDPNGLLPKTLGEIRGSGETGLFIPQTKGSTFDHEYCRVCSSLGDASDVVKAKYKKSADKSTSGNSIEINEGAESND